ncbi:heme utilization cystosolic carrier protein HutX [Rhodospira trueperi]|nr:heme utilization cystosolic carrier protein HutX [Rhodospira trueperi]
MMTETATRTPPPTDTIVPLSPDDPRADVLEVIRARFQESTDGVIEAIATQHGLTPRDVAGCLPVHTGARVDGAHFQAVMDDVADWGEVMVIVHTADLILECRGALPVGQEGHGYFNLRGPGPIGGHIRRDRCGAIQFVSRPFMGSDSHAIMLFNRDGGVMVKIFVGRDETRALRADQVARFVALRDRLAMEGETGHDNDA